MTLKLKGLFVHGLGIGLSTGLDTLAAEVNMIDGVHVDVVEEGAFAYELLGRNEGLLEQIVKSGTHLLMGAHSMGADEVWKMSKDLAHILSEKKLRIPFAFSFDPTWWGTNGGPQGQWQIPSVVEVAASWRQPLQPGGGHIVRAAGNTTTEMHEFECTEPHAGFGSIEKKPEAHAWITEKIIEVLAKL